tara:strand:+ start:11 stop:361 length:351 start_codon:yes stop_codon:yes gene_type:complete
LQDDKISAANTTQTRKQIADVQNLFKKSKIKNSSIPPISIWKASWLSISTKKNCKLSRLKKQKIKKKKKSIFPFLKTVLSIKAEISFILDYTIFLYILFACLIFFLNLEIYQFYNS